MGVAYAGAGAAVVVVGVVLRWWAAPLPWWGVALAGMAAVTALTHGVLSVLSRRTESADRGLRASLGAPRRWLLVAGVSIAVAGWLLLMAGIASHQGQPSDDGVDGCHYYFSERGVQMCVSEREYRMAVAQTQSMGFGAAAFFLGFGAVAAGRPRRKG